MPWNELLLPILSGYVFINIWNLTRFRAQRHDGYRLIIESLFFGVIIFAAARFSVMKIHGSKGGEVIEQLIQQSGLTYPFLGTGILATLFALALALLGNLAVGRELAKKIILARHDNGFMRLFQRAATSSRMVSITHGSSLKFTALGDLPNPSLSD